MRTRNSAALVAALLLLSPGCFDPDQRNVSEGEATAADGSGTGGSGSVDGSGPDPSATSEAPQDSGTDATTPTSGDSTGPDGCPTAVFGGAVFGDACFGP